ncbi:MAG: zf-HC2 domain-containing protein [Rhodocyclaceae bacterium]
MLSCKEVTRLLSESQDRELTLFEGLQLRMHLAMCKGCTNFDRQMKFLRRTSRLYAARTAKSAEAPKADGGN